MTKPSGIGEPESRAFVKRGIRVRKPTPKSAKTTPLRGVFLERFLARGRLDCKPIVETLDESALLGLAGKVAKNFNARRAVAAGNVIVLVDTYRVHAALEHIWQEQERRAKLPSDMASRSHSPVSEQAGVQADAEGLAADFDRVIEDEIEHYRERVDAVHARLDAILAGT